MCIRGLVSPQPLGPQINILKLSLGIKDFNCLHFVLAARESWFGMCTYKIKEYYFLRHARQFE